MKPAQEYVGSWTAISLFAVGCLPSPFPFSNSLSIVLTTYLPIVRSISISISLCSSLGLLFRDFWRVCPFRVDNDMFILTVPIGGREGVLGTDFPVHNRMTPPPVRPTRLYVFFLYVYALLSAFDATDQWRHEESHTLGAEGSFDRKSSKNWWRRRSNGTKIDLIRRRPCATFRSSTFWDTYWEKVKIWQWSAKRSASLTTQNFWSKDKRRLFTCISNY